MGYYVKIYIAVALQDLKAKMSYRADFMINAVGILLNDLLYLASFYLLYHSIDTIGGWELHQILFFYGIMLISTAFMQTFFDNIWELDKRVLSGEFIKYYYKPLNILFYYVSETIDLKGIVQFLFGIGVLVYASVKLQITVTVFFVVRIIVCVTASGMVYVGIMLLTSSLTFWFLNTITILMFVSKAKDYARYPLTIYSKALKFVFTFLFPIGFLSYYPGILLMTDRRQNGLFIGLLLAGALFLGIGYKLWICGTRHYSGTGN